MDGFERGGAGVAEEDADVRPWWVGRAFVECLSLKHCACEERQRLEAAQSVVAGDVKQLLRPEDLSPLGQGKHKEYGAAVSEGLYRDVRSLAEKLGTSPGSENPPALVDHICGRIGEWADEALAQRREGREAKAKLAEEKARRKKDKETKETQMQKLKNTRNIWEKELAKVKQGDTKAELSTYHMLGVEDVPTDPDSRKKLLEGKLEKLNQEVSQAQRKQQEIESDL